MPNETSSSAPEETRSFTKRSRRRKTRAIVKFFDGLARVLITVGGIGTIGAVSLVCFFLLWVVKDLFVSTKLATQVVTTPQSHADQANAPKAAAAAAAAPAVVGPPLKFLIDEFQMLGAVLGGDGTVSLIRLDNGKVYLKKNLFGERKISAASFRPGSDDFCLGGEDGSLLLGKLGFKATFLEEADVPEELRKQFQAGGTSASGASASGMGAVGLVVEHQEGLLTRLPNGQYRLQQLALETEKPIAAVSSSIRIVDHVTSAEGSKVLLLTDDGVFRLGEIIRKKSRRGPAADAQLVAHDVAYPVHAEKKPKWGKIFGTGGSALLIWEDGHALRFDSRAIAKTVLTEKLDLTPEPETSLTAVDLLLGSSTLLVGNNRGTIHGWFHVKPKRTDTPDGSQLTRAHEMSGVGVPVVAFAASMRSRIFTAGYGDGSLTLYHMTSENKLAEHRPAASATTGGAAYSALSMAPKDDGLAAWSEGVLLKGSLQLGHPEASLTSLFLPVWYEDYPEPQHVWQSSSGGQESELKYGLFPLIFGTLKATFYSMIFGVPLALLAAIYSSEFMNPKVKGRVKPTIELMASLPSVVLGFIAVSVVAPFVENVLPETIASFLTIPFALLFGAYLWQLLPSQVALRWKQIRIFFMGIFLLAGIYFSRFLGPWMEREFFAGDIFGWLDGQVGSSLGGWFVLFSPLGIIGTLLLSREVDLRIRHWTLRWNRFPQAVIDLVKFIALAACMFGVAWLAGKMLSSMNYDPRGVFVDTYMQRNSMVVGFVMGFAVIPIIYTIAEDALSTVPQHLRSASLGAGATPWQTAVRIVIPTAMSGLFSAMMVGLGRVVGETMIVLMASGSTPILKVNIFDGLRTLSANIAIEMPEAAKGSSHYLILFLSALSLFAITFVINTVAEVIRQRFRRRAYEL